MKYYLLFLRYLVIGLFLNVSNELFAKIPGDSLKWELRKDKDGIQVYTREHESSGILEYKAISVIDADLDQLIEIINDVDDYPSWTANCKTAEIYEVIDDSTRIEYLTTAVPWPLADRDVVLKYMAIKHTEDYYEAILSAEPEAVPEQDKYVRITISEGSWIFRKINEEQVEIFHQFYSDPGDGIPKWIVNMFIVSGPYKTLLNLKDLCNND
jgi:hypothetical protein